MRILVVDDTESKMEDVRSLVAGIIGDTADIDWVESLQGFREAIEGTSYHIVILDLNIPRNNGEDAEMGLGAEVFDWFKFSPSEILRPKYLIGLTAFSETEAALQQRFDEESFSLLRYSQKENEWRNILAKVIAHATAVNSQAVSSEDYLYDLGIVVALSHIELEALRNLNAGWKQKSFPGDKVLYFEGNFKRKNGSDLSVVITAAAKMGMPATTALAMQLVRSCKPRYLAMSGIAAGIEGRYGDILIAEQAWDYGSGKLKQDSSGKQFLDPAPEPIPIDRGLRARLAEFGNRKAVLDEIKNDWHGSPASDITVQIGAFASGAAVVEDCTVAEMLKAKQRKLVGIDMEIYGLFEAASICSSPTPLAFAVKSICDFANDKKNDDFQKYAAYTSAEFIRRFAVEYL